MVILLSGSYEFYGLPVYVQLGGPVPWEDDGLVQTVVLCYLLSKTNAAVLPLDHDIQVFGFPAQRHVAHKTANGVRFKARPFRAGLDFLYDGVEAAGRLFL